jgi:hypothetical protein
MTSIPHTRFARLAPHSTAVHNQTPETEKAAHAQFRRARRVAAFSSLRSLFGR